MILGCEPAFVAAKFCKTLASSAFTAASSAYARSGDYMGALAINHARLRGWADDRE